MELVVLSLVFRAAVSTVLTYRGTSEILGPLYGLIEGTIVACAGLDFLQASACAVVAAITTLLVTGSESTAAKLFVFNVIGAVVGGIWREKQRVDHEFPHPSAAQSQPRSAFSGKKQRKARVPINRTRVGVAAAASPQSELDPGTPVYLRDERDSPVDFVDTERPVQIVHEELPVEDFTPRVIPSVVKAHPTEKPDAVVHDARPMEGFRPTAEIPRSPLVDEHEELHQNGEPEFGGDFATLVNTPNQRASGHRAQLSSLFDGLGPDVPFVLESPAPTVSLLSSPETPRVNRVRLRLAPESPTPRAHDIFSETGESPEAERKLLVDRAMLHRVKAQRLQRKGESDDVSRDKAVSEHQKAENLFWRAHNDIATISTRRTIDVSYLLADEAVGRMTSVWQLLTDAQRREGLRIMMIPKDSRTIGQRIREGAPSRTEVTGASELVVVLQGLSPVGEEDEE